MCDCRQLLLLGISFQVTLGANIICFWGFVVGGGVLFDYDILKLTSSSLIK